MKRLKSAGKTCKVPGLNYSTRPRLAGGRGVRRGGSIESVMAECNDKGKLARQL